ncbi:MAG: hypothetical protein A2Y81_10615 [Nitrospirae bacterium RBG_13_43_8]|nr:MAG: hypothetical protein A2Y81_10615 [Nitrospirae bacterium RBG_13_43_8]
MLTKSNINKADIDTWQLWRGMALLCSAELLEKLAPIDELETTYATYSESNAQNYFLLKILIEVQKTGFSMGRWIKHVETKILGACDKKQNNIDDMEMESLIDEQSVWQRKLFEALTAQICFNECNDSAHYYHYFLLQDLAHYQALRKEQKDFFFEENKFRENKIKILKAKINVVEKLLPDLSQCWYLKKDEKSGRILSGHLASARQTMLSALKVAAPRERTSLGYTYDKTFAETSRNIHFNPIREDIPDLLGRFKFGMAQCGSLIVSNLLRSQQLSGHILSRIKGPKYGVYDQNQDSKTNPTRGIAKIGDFVLAGGLYLAEVLDIKINAFGYESYRVKYLDERPFSEIDEDWLPSFNVQIYQDRKSFIEDLDEKLKKTQEQEKLEPIEFSDEEKIEATMDTLIEVWKLAMKDYLRNTYKDHFDRITRQKW